MATKFSTIYRQELKNKGALAALGAAAGKGLVERMDIRNLLFSGQGFIRSTGKKIFGKGYSPIKKTGAKVSGLSDTPSVELTSLQQSNERQEALLKVVAKNTLNMNMMARDMNITRQNITSLTKKVTGRSAKAADALWINSSQRNDAFNQMYSKEKTPVKQLDDPKTSAFNMNLMVKRQNSILSNISSLFKRMADRRETTKTDSTKRNVRNTANESVIARSIITKRDTPSQSTSPQKQSSSSSFLGGIIAGMAGIGGSVGSVIFRTLGSIIAISPLLGIVGMAASAYAIKKMSEDINFQGIYESVKKGIAGVLGINLESEEPILRQLAENLNNIFNTKKFTDIYDWIDQKFGVDFQKIKDGIEEGTKLTMAYTEAAFKVLSFNFGKFGEIFSFHFKEFINQYKPELLLTLGAAIGGSVGSLFGIKGAALGALVGGAVGYITGKITQTRSTEDIEKSIAEYEKKIEVSNRRLSELDPNKLSHRGEIKGLKEQNEKLEGFLRRDYEELNAQNARLESLRIKPENFALPGNENYNAIIEESLRKRGLTTDSTTQATSSARGLSPTRVDHSTKAMIDLIRSKFLLAGYSEAQAQAAVANAIQESGLNPLIKSRAPGEESYGLFQINRKAHPEFSVRDLLDPEKNIDAMLKVMKKSPRDDEIFKSITDVEKATRYFGLRMSRPTDKSDEAMQKRIDNLQKIPGLMLTKQSTDLSTATRSVSVQTEPTVVTIPVPQSQVVQQTSAPKPSTPQVGNPDAVELFFNLSFPGTTR